MTVLSCLTIVLLFFVIRHTHGLHECRDKEPCSDYEVMCGNPGVSDRCMRTCGACRDTSQGPECTTGHVEQDSECRLCSEQNWHVIMTNRDCPQDCTPGRWGSRCQEYCSDKCFTGRCEKWSGQCIGGCEDGYYGSRCELHCENCGFHGRCHIDGECIHGCKDGWRGISCNERND